MCSARASTAACTPLRQECKRPCASVVKRCSGPSISLNILFTVPAMTSSMVSEGSQQTERAWGSALFGKPISESSRLMPGSIMSSSPISSCVACSHWLRARAPAGGLDRAVGRARRRASARSSLARGGISSGPRALRRIVKGSHAAKRRATPRLSLPTGGDGCKGRWVPGVRQVTTARLAVRDAAPPFTSVPYLAVPFCSSHCRAAP